MRKNRALTIAETSPGAANGIFHDLDYLRFFQRLPKLKLHVAKVFVWLFVINGVAFYGTYNTNGPPGSSRMMHKL